MKTIHTTITQIYVTDTFKYDTNVIRAKPNKYSTKVMHTRIRQVAYTNNTHMIHKLYT